MLSNPSVLNRASGEGAGVGKGGREEGPLHWEKEDEHLSTRKLKMGWKTGGVKGFLKEI